MAEGFMGIIELLKSFGIFEFYLPFVILFGLIYGLLEKSKIIGDRRLNAVIAVSAALFIMAYNPVGVTLTTFFSQFFTSVAVVLVTMLGFAMMIWLMIPISGKEKPTFEKAAKYIGFIVAIIMIGIFISAGGLQIILPGLGGTLPGLEGIGIDAQDLIIIVLIIVMILVIIFVTREDGGRENRNNLQYWPVPMRT